jgi:hypothetical protein
MLTHRECARARATTRSSQPGIGKMVQVNAQPGLQMIGGLTSRIVNTLTAGGTTTHGSTNKPKDSKIGASGTIQPTRSGTRPGVPESETLKNSLPTIVARTELLGYLHRDPARLLMPCVKSSLAETWEGNNTGHGWDGYVSRYELTAPISEDDRQTALAFAEETLAPAGEAFVISELGRLRALTVSRDVGQDLALVFAAYADELTRYPADAVREVLRSWPKSGGKFWPSMAELEERLNVLVAPRQALRDALKRGYREPEYSPDWTPPPTAEQVAEARKFLAENGVSLDENGIVHGRERPLERRPMTREDRARMARELAEFRAKWNANVQATADAAE